MADIINLLCVVGIAHVFGNNNYSMLKIEYVSDFFLLLNPCILSLVRLKLKLTLFFIQENH